MKSLCVILAASSLLPPAAGLAADTVNGIEAIVHDSVITRQALISDVLQALHDQYRNQPNVDEKKLQAERLDQLMERQLILHDFKTSGYSLPESVIEDEVQARIKARYPDRASFIKTLQEEGITFERYRQQVRDQFIIENMRYKNVSGEVIISPHKIETYYAAHTNDLNGEEMIKLRVEEMVKLRILLLNKASDTDSETRRLADEILAKIKEGAAFSEMMSIYTQGSKAEREWEKSSALKKELAAAITNLKAGDVSDVIETGDTCYIVLVEGKHPAYVRPLAEVRDEIEQMLRTQEKDRLSKQWIDRLKKKTFIRYGPL